MCPVVNRSSGHIFLYTRPLLLYKHLCEIRFCPADFRFAVPETEKSHSVLQANNKKCVSL